MLGKIADLLTGKSVQSYYSIYNKTQWFNNKQMYDLQLTKLRDLVNHCYEHVPYYNKLMNSLGFTPNDITSLEDVKRFPILTKEIIKANYEDFKPKNLNQLKGVKLSQTGGTTGNILFKRNDAQTRSSIWATFKRFSEEWMGVKERDKKLIMMGGHVIGHSLKSNLKKSLVGWFTNSVYFSPYDTSDKNLERIVYALENNNFKLIRSYSQFLFQLALYLKSKGKTFHVGAITTTAEAILPEHRALFREVFNAEVFDQYGCGEIGGVAYECNHHNGLHIAHERVIVEQNDNLDLIITDLDNYSMPFIRYWNADQAEISDEPCTCGRHGKMIKRIMGRTCDYVVGVNQKKLHWAYFWHLFFDSNLAKERNLKKFQVVQTDANTLKIRLICEVISDSEKALLIDNIQSRLGDMQIHFVFETEIENTKTGKYRPVINQLLN